MLKQDRKKGRERWARGNTLHSWRLRWYTLAVATLEGNNKIIDLILFVQTDVLEPLEVHEPAAEPNLPIRHQPFQNKQGFTCFYTDSALGDFWSHCFLLIEPTRSCRGHAQRDRGFVSSITSRISSPPSFPDCSRENPLYLSAAIGAWTSRLWRP